MWVSKEEEQTATAPSEMGAVLQPSKAYSECQDQKLTGVGGVVSISYPWRQMAVLSPPVAWVVLMLGVVAAGCLGGVAMFAILLYRHRDSKAEASTAATARTPADRPRARKAPRVDIPVQAAESMAQQAPPAPHQPLPLLSPVEEHARRPAASAAAPPPQLLKGAASPCLLRTQSATPSRPALSPAAMPCATPPQPQGLSHHPWAAAATATAAASMAEEANSPAVLSRAGSGERPATPSPPQQLRGVPLFGSEVASEAASPARTDPVTPMEEVPASAMEEIVAPPSSSVLQALHQQLDDMRQLEVVRGEEAGTLQRAVSALPVHREQLWSPMPDGEHGYVWPDGSEYYGEWKNGQPEGRGTFLWPSGARHEGEWRDGCENGVGTATSADGSTFYGFWLDGKRHGRGVYRPSTGSNRRADVIFMRLYDFGQLVDETVLRVKDKDLRKSEEKKQARRSKQADKREAKAARQEEGKAGETIYKGHPSYLLMRTLQLGVLFSIAQGGNVSRGGAGPTLEDFKAQVEQYFPRSGQLGSFKWKDYCPAIFHCLREIFNVDPRDYLLSITGERYLRELPSPGKSGSVFFMSDDDRFFIKTVRKGEKRLLLDLIPQYFAHVEQHPRTLLTQFYGLHRIKPLNGAKVRFVVMGNVFPSTCTIHRKYDLKGSTHGRTAGAKAAKRNAILKDLDVDARFELAGDVYDEMMATLRADCALLERLHIIDYSLLLGVHYHGWGDRWYPPGEGPPQGEENYSTNLEEVPGVSGGEEELEEGGEEDDEQHRGRDAVKRALQKLHVTRQIRHTRSGYRRDLTRQAASDTARAGPSLPPTVPEQGPAPSREQELQQGELAAAGPMSQEALRPVARYSPAAGPSPFASYRPESFDLDDVSRQLRQEAAAGPAGAPPDAGFASLGATWEHLMQQQSSSRSLSLGTTAVPLWQRPSTGTPRLYRANSVGGSGGPLGSIRPPSPPAPRSRRQLSIAEPFDGEDAADGGEELALPQRRRSEDAAGGGGPGLARLPSLWMAPPEDLSGGSQILRQPSKLRLQESGVPVAVEARALSRTGADPQHVTLFFGIIDFLQDYSLRKRAEHALKRVYMERRAMSVVDPHAYSERFLEAMQALFVREGAAA